MQELVDILSEWIGSKMQVDLSTLLGIDMHVFMKDHISENVQKYVRDLIGFGVEGNWFYYIAPVFVLLLVAFWKKRRVKFAVPALIIMVMILNPVAKNLFEKTTETAYYWRLLWIVPIIPVCAALPGMIEEKIKPEYLKGLITVAFAGLFVLLGSYTYDQRLVRFFIPANEEKIEQPFVDAADTLLTYDDHPYVVADPWPSVFIRQYTPRIRMLYGRDMMGYGVSSSLAKNMYNQLSAEDYTGLSASMLDEGCEYLLTYFGDEGKQEALEKAGFELLNRVDVYGIYRVHGKPSVKKERNELGQVLTVTCIDENGNPQIGDNGYATITYNYDNNGHIIREFHTDLSGKGVADTNGYAGYERAYDSRDHIILKRTLGDNGLAISNNCSYAEIRREYQRNNLVKESYFDENGKAVNRTDTGYAIITFSYDWNGNIIQERYYGADGHAIKSSVGYAGKDLKYDDNGNLILESYIDENGKRTNNVNGYAAVKREYDQNRNITRQQFLNAEGKLVVTGSGFAEVHRVYDGKHLITEKYYGADGEEFYQPAGYCAIEQRWEGDLLVSRTYLNADMEPVNRTDRYARAVWEQGEKCTNVKFYTMDDMEVPIDGVNLVRDVKTNEEGWSDWQIPKYNILNSTQNIGYLNLGAKEEGDIYSCTIEIEFRDITATEGSAFRFWAQGAQDGKWITGNVWNNALVNLSDVPQNGIYRYTSEVAITGEMTDISTFNLGFRCDYWASGMYRVRFVKVEKGEICSEWSPGL